MKSTSGLWRDVLESARSIVKKNRSLTSVSMSEETGFTVKVASAWLSILGKYGYLRRIGREPRNKRWQYLWELTRFGIEYRPGKRLAKRPPARQPAQLRIAANPKSKES